MKKIISMIVVAVLFTTAAFAQDRRQSYDNRYSGNSYQNQYSVNNGYGYSPYERNRRTYGNNYRYNRYDRYRNTRVIYRQPRRQARYYPRTRSGVSIQLHIGSGRRY